MAYQTKELKLSSVVIGASAKRVQARGDIIAVLFGKVTQKTCELQEREWRLETMCVAGARVRVWSGKGLTWERAFWDRLRKSPQDMVTAWGSEGASGREEKAAEGGSEIASLGDE